LNNFVKIILFTKWINWWNIEASQSSSYHFSPRLYCSSDFWNEKLSSSGIIFNFYSF